MEPYCLQTVVTIRWHNFYDIDIVLFVDVVQFLVKADPFGGCKILNKRT